MEEKKENVVFINTDPKAGPLDNAVADVVLAKTKISKDKMKHANYKGRISASYELGVISFSVPSTGDMITARIDEVMQVLFAASGAFKKMQDAKKGEEQE